MDTNVTSTYQKKHLCQQISNLQEDEPIADMTPAEYMGNYSGNSTLKPATLQKFTIIF
jgi:hypothetical protein